MFEILPVEKFLKKYKNEENDLIYPLRLQTVKEITLRENKLFGITVAGKEIKLDPICPNCKKTLDPNENVIYFAIGFENDPIFCQNCFDYEKLSREPLIIDPKMDKRAILKNIMSYLKHRYINDL